MKRLALLLLAALGCVDGDPVGPVEPSCPDVVIYLTFDPDAPRDSALVTDSIRYTGKGCS